MDAIELLNDFPYFKGEELERWVSSGKHCSMVELFVRAIKLLKDFPYATVQDVEMIFLSPHGNIIYTFFGMGIDMHCISAPREAEKLEGKDSISYKRCNVAGDYVKAGPLLHLHSLHVQPKDAIKDTPLSIYGTVRVKYDHIQSGKPMQLDVYSRSADDADSISPNGGNFTLGLCGTSLSRRYDMWVGLQGTTIEVDLHLKIGDEVVPLAQDEILVGETTEGDLEEVRSKEFHGLLCSATLVYIAMPFAVLCLVDISLSSKDKGRVVNVAGKIAARYKSTYGNYDSQEFVLFEKQNDFEPLNMENDTTTWSTWMGLPAYSTLELDVDLTDFNTRRKLIKKTVELFKSNTTYADSCAVVEGDFAILVGAKLIEYPLDRMWSYSDEDLCENELSSSNNGNPWCPLHGQQKIPQPSKLVEFYSIFIGRKELAALNIYGTVEFSSNNHTEYLFKKTSNDAVEVKGSQKVLPFIDVYRKVVQYKMLELKVNLKDVGGKFQNKAFAIHDLGVVYHGLPHNTQICSVFPGKDGFCALHYSIFSDACNANIEILFRIKGTQLGAGMIYGSAVAQYINFDYSTEFKRDYFRSVLFERTEKNPLQLESDGKVPLSRSLVAVPMDSSLIIDIDFCCMSLNDHLSCKEMFRIGRCCSKTEKNDLELVINCTWSDGK
ncbi:unnamed protein product [Cuscuta campestris]|uniref:DUF6598 domain-containing protein n=1 Tax=Cuscuta campestris TaxID=132261 RepID=A0A484L1H9_9ASTE|nr:unnamed protein product [Cuscuta campestris]